MQVNNYKTTYSTVEKFIIEKIQELCYNRSLDSYRVKYLNPKVSLSEFYRLINDWNANKIKDFKTIVTCGKEVDSFLKNETYLDFGEASIDRLKEDINNLIKKEFIPESLEYELYYLINNNESYLKRLLNEIDAIKNSSYIGVEQLIPCFIKLDELINFCITEAVNLNFSKSYLHKLNQALFIHNSTKSFSESWDVFKEKILTTINEEYYVIFSIEGSENQLSNITLAEVVNQVNQSLFATPIEAKLSNFIKQKAGKRFVVAKVEALDYYQAMKLSKKELAKVLDRIHIRYSNFKIEIRETAIIINSRNKEKADLQPIHYQVDGYYSSDNEQYEKFIQDLQSIDNNQRIEYEVKDRINSALRQLRLGNEAIEIEKKFINYWIGLEYIFSNYVKDKSTFKRLLNYLPVVHSVYYVKRNLLHFHDSIRSFETDISTDDELLYLTNVDVYDKLIQDYIDKYPLLSYRASRFKGHLMNNSEKRVDYLNKHKSHLDWHLVRLYRIRNELIHDAAIIENIENLTGNLRYYLNFILNKLIEYFSDCRPKPLINKPVSMDDFFMHHQMIWDNLKEKKMPLENSLKLKYDMEYLR